MYSPGKIVVGVELPDTHPWDAANLSAPSRLAVRRAFDLAEGLGSALTLVTVLDEAEAGLFTSAPDAEQIAAENAEAASVLEDLKQQYCEKSKAPPKVTCEVRTGRPWLEILKCAGSSHDNLIICGTRDTGAVSRFLFGSTGQKLLRNAACPVLLNKPRIDDDSELDVLAATDLSEVGEDILQTSVGMAQALPVRLHIMHAIDRILDRHIARAGASPEEIEKYKSKTREEAEAKLNDQLSLTDYRTLEHGSQVHLAEGPAESCLLAAIEELDIDLLVMATSGRGGVPGMLFGNTAERLLQEIPCSLLAIKPDDFQCPVDVS